ncbi:MAG: SBBP repeat-containing protein [Candidatus Aminicenantales bacterium]
MRKGLALVLISLAISAGLLLVGRANGQTAPFTPAAASLGPERIWNTFLGGAARDWAFAIAIDGNRNTYMTGLSAATWGSPLNPFGGGYDVFVAKLDANGSLLWNTFLGGPDNDIGYGIAVDTNGNVYINGFSKTTWDSPILPYSALEDGFVAKLAANGSLLWNTFLGGPGYDRGQGRIVVDADGNSYVTGQSNASWGTPVTPYAGGWDGYAAKLDTNGSLQWSTFVGGSSNEYGLGIALDKDGNPYVSGYNYAVGGVQDAFVARLNAGGSLQWNTPFGGPGWDMGSDIVVDGSGNSCVAGRSGAAWGTPVNPFAGGDDVLVAKLDANGSLLWHTFLGGSGNDIGSGIALDARGNVYVTGDSGTTWGWPASPFAGGRDAFAARLDSDGSLRFNTFLGGAGEAMGSGIALDASGDCYLVGSEDATWGSPLRPYVGDWDGFVAKISPTAVAAPVLTSLLPGGANAGDPAFLLTVVGSGFVDGAVVRWDGSDRPTTFVSSSEVDGTIDASDLAAGKTVQVTVRNPGGGISDALAFAVDNPVPTLSSLSTTNVTGGGAAFTITVLGSNFVPSSVVRWNGSDRTTTYVSSVELQAAIPASDLATGGDVPVTVFNPAPVGGLTSALSLHVSSFTTVANPSSKSVTAGQSATYTIQVNPQYGSFDAPITFTCSGLPSKCTATFSAASVTPGTSAATTTMTLATRASAGVATASLSGMTGFGQPTLGLFVLALSLLLAWTIHGRLSRQVSRRWLVACALICLVMLIGSCSSDGGDTYTGTPKGTHQISVQGTSGTMTVPTVVTLIVN